MDNSSLFEVKLMGTPKKVAMWAIAVTIVIGSAISIVALLRETIFRQPTVWGMVVSSTGSPIKGAHIQLSDRRTVTGVGGLFEFKNVDPDPPRQEFIVRNNNRVVAETIVDIRRGRDTIVHVVLSQEALGSDP